MLWNTYGDHLTSPKPQYRQFATLYPVPSTQYPVPSTQYPVPSTQYPVPSTQYPLPSPSTCLPMTQYSRVDIREEVEVVVRIEDFGFTGEGYVRLEDGWLSVPGALPGELVRVRLQEGQREGSRRLFADVVQVLEPSQERRDPLCKRDEICRGCQLRHLTVAGELRFKVRTVREVMERYAGLDEKDQPQIEVVTPQPTLRGDAFRIRSSLSYRRRGEDFELGLNTAVREELIPMVDCPALVGPVQRLVASVTQCLSAQRHYPWDEEMVRQVRRRVGDIEISVGIRRVDVVAPNHGVGLVNILTTEPENEDHFQREVDGELLAPWLERLCETVPEKVGVAVSGGGFRRYVKEPRSIRIPIGKWNMEVGYDDWFHATLEPAESVYARMMEWLELDEGDRLIDIGCGTGTISLMASEKAQQVVGVDANVASIEVAEINAVGHGCEHVRFEVGGWEKVLRNLALDEERFSVATINPMREPLGRRALAFLRQLEVERLVYLGPSPEAAARDIGELREMGWTVERLAAGNLHPATYHTLLMAKCRR